MDDARRRGAKGRGDRAQGGARGAARCAAVALALLLGAEAAWATNGTRLIGVGARAISRGGVDVGIADDATALHSNPGGLGFVDGNRIDSLTLLAFPSVRVSNDIDRARSNVTLPLLAGSFAFAFDLDEPFQFDALVGLEDLGAPVYGYRDEAGYRGSGIKLGFGIFPLAGNKIDLEFTTPFWDADAAAGLAREPQGYKTDLAELAVTLGVAWRVNEFISIGLAPSFVYSQLQLAQPTAAPVSILQGHPLTNDPSPPPGELTYADLAPALGISQIEGYADVDDARTFGFRMRVGALITPTPWLRIGITYATQTFKLNYVGESTVDFDRQLQKLDGVDLGGVGLGGTLKSVVEQNTGIPRAVQSYRGRGNVEVSPFDSPQEVGLGFALRFDRVLVGLDVYWLNWSQTYEEATIEVTNNTSAELNELTGDTSQTQRITIPLDWSDQFVVAIGGAFAVTDSLVVRAGYNYGKNPIPSDTLLPSAPAILEHHVTAGVSYYWRRFELSLVGEYALPNRVRLSDDHRGNSSLSGVTVEASAFFVGFSLGARF